MSLRPPRFLSPAMPMVRTGLAVLEAEMAAEQASALGRMGRDLEVALDALKAFDTKGAGARADRAALVQTAADATWRYFVQRESVGVNDHRLAIRDYAIPRDVLNRIGARGPHGRLPRP